MRKGEVTHQAIIEQAVSVFNTRGYAGTSIGDLTSATQLSKGAIYNHFANKDDLAIQVFDYAVEYVNQLFAEAVRAAPRHAIKRLIAIVQIYQNYSDDPLLVGGCPVLNTAVEADDTHPELRAHAQAALEGWHSAVVRILERGIREKQVRPDIDPDTVATIIISAIEGGVMMSKLDGNSAQINRVVAFLTDYLETTVQAS